MSTGFAPGSTLDDTSDPLTQTRTRPIIMPMQAESLDVLEKADLPPAQARAIVGAIEIEISGAKDTLAESCAPRSIRARAV